MLRSNAVQALGEGNSVRLKSYCYALRSALAIAWIRQRGSTDDDRSAHRRAHAPASISPADPPVDRAQARICGKRNDGTPIQLRYIRRRCSFGPMSEATAIARKRYRLGQTHFSQGFCSAHRHHRRARGVASSVGGNIMHLRSFNLRVLTSK
jgi:hypothetical protein